MAIIRKTKPLPWERKLGCGESQNFESSLLSRRARNNLSGREMKKKIRGKVELERGKKTYRVGNFWHPKSFFTFAPKNDPEMSKIIEFYGIGIEPNLFYSPTSSRNTIYVTNSRLKSILVAKNPTLNVFHAGAKVRFDASVQLILGLIQKPF